MKFIFNNIYLTLLKFNTYREYSQYKANQYNVDFLLLNDNYGDYFYCFEIYDSLTNEIKKIISFSSDYKDENLYSMYSKTTKTLIIHTGKKLFFIDKEFKIISSYDIITPLVSLYETINDRIIILEEASITIVDESGIVLKKEFLGMITKYWINDNKLTIVTEDVKEFIVDLKTNEF